jgi:hypothetical protein
MVGLLTAAQGNYKYVVVLVNIVTAGLKRFF